MIKDVDITITRETMSLTQAGFGLPLIAAFQASGETTFELCSDLTAVEDAGFATTSGTYKMAEKIFSQSPSPPEIAVAELVEQEVNAKAVIEAAGGAEIEIEATDNFSGTAGNAKTVEVTNDTETGTETLDVSYDTDTLTIELDGGVHSAADIVTAVNGVANFKASRLASGDFTTEDTQVEDFSGGEDDSISGALNDLMKDQSDWYFLLSPEQAEADVKELSGWAQANKKLYFSTPDGTVNNAITIATDLANSRTALMYHDDNESYPDAAWVGRCAPENPGSITWKFKTLQGISPADVSVTDVRDLHSANVNTYIKKLGVNQTSEGMNIGNEFIDIIRGQDWVDAKMSEAVHRLLFTSPKVPYDNRGIAMLINEVKSILQFATDREIVALDNDGNGMWEIDAPDREDIPTNYIANRILPDVYFEYIAAGAIHEVKIRGVISL